jgi:hypothetical protein
LNYGRTYKSLENTGSEKIYENPWIELTEFQVINPTGGNGIYGKVHFKHKAVGVIPWMKTGIPGSWSVSFHPGSV